MYLSGLVLIILAILSGHQIDAARRLNSILDILGESYDRIHELVVLDQIDNYIRPIESLETRNCKTLNGLWSFCLDPANEGHRLKWFEKNLRDECVGRGNYFIMPVPSAFNDIPSNKTVKNYMGWMWYQTELRLPQIGSSRQPLAGNRVNTWILQMDSINYLSIIWVQIIADDGRAYLVGAHAGGHLPITLDLSDILNINESGHTARYANIRITIAVSNMLTSETIPSGKMINVTESVGRAYFRFQPDFDFFHFAGIMGDVNLIELPASYIADVDITYRKSSLALAYLNLTLSLPFSEPIQVCWLLSGIQGGGASSKSLLNLSKFNKDFDCSTLEPGTRQQSFPIKDKLVGWASGLILLENFNNDSRKVYDLVELKLPINRLSSESADLGWMLGGRHGGRHGGRGLQGFGMHHEQLFSGRTMSLASIMKDLNLVKQMGANIVRTSHYPYSRAYLDACDQLNLLVIAECPAVGLNKFTNLKLIFHKQILLEMMERDQRHPSIIMWSLANEPESQLAGAQDYFAKLIKYAHKDLIKFTLNAGRPLTVAIAQSHADDTIGQLFDVIMINRYYGWYECTALIECIRHSLLASLEGWAAKYPGKPLIISEFGADTLAGVHSVTSEIFSEEYQRDLLVAYEQVFDELVARSSSSSSSSSSCSGSGSGSSSSSSLSGGVIGLNETVQQINFIGSMIWNFADFSTHESLMRPSGNRKGVFTRLREPKLAVESIKSIYTGRNCGPNVSQI